MAAQPKKKTSHRRTHQRRSHDRANVGAIILCSHCRRPHLSHRVCGNCGYYGGREVIVEKPSRSTE
jgi:large subunit ribosomal protein L32